MCCRIPSRLVFPFECPMMSSKKEFTIFLKSANILLTTKPKYPGRLVRPRPPTLYSYVPLYIVKAVFFFEFSSNSTCKNPCVMSILENTFPPDISCTISAISGIADAIRIVFLFNARLSLHMRQVSPFALSTSGFCHKLVDLLRTLNRSKRGISLSMKIIWLGVRLSGRCMPAGASSVVMISIGGHFTNRLTSTFFVKTPRNSMSSSIAAACSGWKSSNQAKSFVIFAKSSSSVICGAFSSEYWKLSLSA